MATRKKTSRKKAVNATAEDNTTAKEEKAGGPLTAEAFAELTRSIYFAAGKEERAVSKVGFMNVSTAQKLADWRGGGTGERATRNDYEFRSIVLEGKSPLEVFPARDVENVRRNFSAVGNLEQIYVRCVLWGEDPKEVYDGLAKRATVRRDEGKELGLRDQTLLRIVEEGEDVKTVLAEMVASGTLSDEEKISTRLGEREMEIANEIQERNRRDLVIYEIVVRQEDPQKVYAHNGVDKEGVERRLSATPVPLDVDDLKKVVYKEVGVGTCYMCKGEVRPVCAHKIRGDLSELDSRRLENAFAGDGKGLFYTRGNYVLVLNEDGLLEPTLVCGPHNVDPKFFQGPSCALIHKRKTGDYAPMGFAEAQERARRHNEPLQEERALEEAVEAMQKHRRRPLRGGGATAGSLDIGRR